MFGWIGGAPMRSDPFVDVAEIGERPATRTSSSVVYRSFRSELPLGGWAKRIHLSWAAGFVYGYMFGQDGLFRPNSVAQMSPETACDAI
jgi:hypothetical protein